MKKKESNFKYPCIVGEMAKHGDTQEALGDVLGITRQQVRYKLIGKYEWTISEIEKLCDYYKKDYYELFKGE